MRIGINAERCQVLKLYFNFQRTKRYTATWKNFVIIDECKGIGSIIDFAVEQLGATGTTKPFTAMVMDGDICSFQRF